MVHFTIYPGNGVTADILADNMSQDRYSSMDHEMKNGFCVYAIF
jgi:hypothetical protein